MARSSTQLTNAMVDGSERNRVGWAVDGKNLTLKAVADLLESEAPLEVAPEALEAVKRSRAIVETRAIGEKALYGINTGFGVLAHERIPAKDLETFTT